MVMIILSILSFIIVIGCCVSKNYLSKKSSKESHDEDVFENEEKNKIKEGMFDAAFDDEINYISRLERGVNDIDKFISSGKFEQMQPYDFIEIDSLRCLYNYKISHAYLVLYGKQKIENLKVIFVKYTLYPEDDIKKYRNDSFSIDEVKAIIEPLKQKVFSKKVDMARIKDLRNSLNRRNNESKG